GRFGSHCGSVISRSEATSDLHLPNQVPILFCSRDDRRHLHSFPTRRSSDLFDHRLRTLKIVANAFLDDGPLETLYARAGHHRGIDRKSTRLNSSHVEISYAVFCLKKKSTQSMTSLK